MFRCYNLSSCSKRNVTVDVCHYTYVLHGTKINAWGQHFGANEGIFVARTFPKIPQVSSPFVGFCCILGGRQHFSTKNLSKTPKTPCYSESLSFANLSAVWKFVLSSGSWTLPTRRVVTLFMIPSSIGPSTVRRLGVFHRSNPATVCTRW